MTKRELQSARYQRIGPSTYQHAGATATALQRLQVALRRLPPNAAFSGATAAWLHGNDCDPCSPIDVTLPANSPLAAKAGVRTHRAQLDGDVVIVRGLPATSIVRTLADLALRVPLIEAVVAADEATHRGLLTVDDLTTRAAQRAGRPGAKRLRRVIQLIEPAAESPMETRLRLILVLAGFPPPEVQANLRDDRGILLGRVDLCYRQARLVIEYDGAHHRDRVAEDARRQNVLQAAGFRILRFTATDVFNHPTLVQAQVRAALDHP